MCSVGCWLCKTVKLLTEATCCVVRYIIACCMRHHQLFSLRSQLNRLVQHAQSLSPQFGMCHVVHKHWSLLIYFFPHKILNYFEFDIHWSLIFCCVWGGIFMFLLWHCCSPLATCGGLDAAPVGCRRPGLCHGWHRGVAVYWCGEPVMIFISACSSLFLCRYVFILFYPLHLKKKKGFKSRK